MLRRLVAILGALTLGLASVASASADQLYPMTGYYLTAEGGACTGDLLLCTGATLQYQDYDAGAGQGMCLELRHSSEGIVYETEYGCWDDADPLGKLHYSSGLLVGIGPTTIAMLSDLTDQYRDVTLSLDTAISTNIARFTEDGTVQDGNGCTVTWLSRVKTADTTGTMTVEGDDLATVATTETRQTKAKTRC